MSHEVPGGLPTPREAEVLAAVAHYHGALGEACPAAHVARKLGIARQTARDYFNALFDLGLLRAGGSPAIPTKKGTLTICQVHRRPSVGHPSIVQTRTVQLAPLSIRAEVLAKGVDDEARTVDLVFTSGAAVERYDWMSGKRYLETLSLDPSHVRLDRINSGGPLLDSHSGYSVAGIIGAVVDGSVQVSKKEGRATVRFSKRADVEPIWQDVRDKIIRHVSVGYRVYKFEEDAGKGNALPVRKAIDWEPFEISMVAIPADPKASTRSDKVETNPCEVVSRGQEGTMDDDKPTPTTPDATAARAAAAAATEAERTRAETIRMAVRAARLDATLADDMVKRGIALDAARAEILDSLAAAGEATQTTQRTTVGEDQRDKWRRGAMAGLIHRAGSSDLIRQAMKAKPDHPAFKGLSLDPGEFRGLTLRDLAREVLERAGVTTRGMTAMEIAGLALRGGMNTTSDFAVALESVLHKTLLAAYIITPDTWQRFCSVGSVTDFRPHPRYRSAFLSRLDSLNSGGEFKNKSIPDTAKESITATTKGNILALSRQAIVNDDMSVFSRVAAQFGRAAALSIEMDVYDTLALNAGLGPLMNDGLTLFHATHLNVGAGAALSVASLDADRVVLASQKDPSTNEILDLRPATLLIAIGLGGQARVINSSQYDTDIVANKFLVPNKVVGLFRDVVDTPRLAGTRRYLFVDPAQMPVLEVAFLEGQQEPFMDMQDGWRVDGVEWKARLDYGVAAVEFRGAITNAGV